MASNPDFKKIVVKGVEFIWPRLDQPYRYNERDKKSEPCAATAPNASRSIGWIMDMEAGKALFMELKAHYAECLARNSKLPKFAEVFSMKKDEEAGTVQFTAKKNAMTRDGDPSKVPTIVGPDLLDLADKAIWSGSKGHIRALAFPSTNPQDGTGGISLLLDAVQVTDPQYGSDGLEDDFGPADPSFGEQTQPPANVKADASELEDDVAF